MSPKEKAEELLNKYYLDLKQDSVFYDLETARMCALICVNEVIMSGSVFKYESNIDFTEHVKNWRQVKQEIENYESTDN